MLILERKIGQQVIIDGKMVVELTHIAQNSNRVAVSVNGLRINLQLEQTALIAPYIHITLLSFKGNRASLGFEAPKSVSLHRKEIQDRVDRELAIARNGVVALS